MKKRVFFNMGHCGIASAVVTCAVLARSKTKISKITKYYNKGTIPVKCETTLLQHRSHISKEHRSKISPKQGGKCNPRQKYTWNQIKPNTILLNKYKHTYIYVHTCIYKFKKNFIDPQFF